MCHTVTQDVDTGMLCVGRSREGGRKDLLEQQFMPWGCCSCPWQCFHHFSLLPEKHRPMSAQETLLMQPACQHLQPWQSQVSQVMSKPEVCKRPSGFQSELLLCMRVDLGETSLSSDASQLYAQPTDSEHQTSGCLMPMTQPGLHLSYM